jgi:hypothetical protein
MEEKLTLTVFVKRRDLDMILDIGAMPDREVKGPDLEKEYEATQKEPGYAVLEAYRNIGLTP